MLKRILAILVCIIMVMPSIVYGEAELRPANLEAPQNLTVELKEHEDGKPYFQLSWINPSQLLQNYPQYICNIDFCEGFVVCKHHSQ